MGWCVDSKTDAIYGGLSFSWEGVFEWAWFHHVSLCVGVKITNFTPTIHQNFGWDGE